MIVEFRFNSKSSGQNVPEAIRIAKHRGGVIENKFYKVKFDDPLDNDLKRLYELVGALKGSAIVLEEGEPLNTRKFFEAVSCSEVFLCKGTCRHAKLGYYDIQTFLTRYSVNIKDKIFTTSEQSLITHLTNFLEQAEENKFKFDKELFLEYFIQETALEEKYCPKYDLKKAQKEIEKLPDEIDLIPYEESFEYQQKYREEEVGLASLLKDVFQNCQISSKLSLSEAIACSRSITYLIKAVPFILIENTEIFIASFPDTSQIVLLRFLFDDEVEQYQDREEEETKYIVTKEQDFYCARNPFSALYFKLIDEKDPTLDESYNRLKLLKLGNYR